MLVLAIGIFVGGIAAEMPALSEGLHFLITKVEHNLSFADSGISL